MGWFGTYETSSLRLEASTICQLACPSCATTHGTIKAQIGAGFLKFNDFRRLVDENPWVWEIELSNWGEIFLNPDIERIIAYAYRRSVALMACNGANLNHVKEGVLEAMVRYKFRAITCSIDGVSQGTYEAYRRKGQLDRVLGNIRRLNEYKKRWKSEYPMLCWQMIAFGHNEHEIAAARTLASELGMAFCLKINYDDDFSPVKERDAVRQTVARTRLRGGGAPGRAGRVPDGRGLLPVVAPAPDQLRRDIARMLREHVGVVRGERVCGRVKRALEAEKLRYAKEMLQGKVPPRDDVPCATCAIYLNRAEARRWLVPSRRARPQGISQETGHGALDGVGRQPAGKMVAAGADAAATARCPYTLGQEVGSASPAALAPEQQVRAEHAPEMCEMRDPRVRPRWPGGGTRPDSAPSDVLRLRVGAYGARAMPRIVQSPVTCHDQSRPDREHELGGRGLGPGDHGRSRPMIGRECEGGSGLRSLGSCVAPCQTRARVLKFLPSAPSYLRAPARSENDRLKRMSRPRPEMVSEHRTQVCIEERGSLGRALIPNQRRGRARAGAGRFYLKTLASTFARFASAFTHVATAPVPSGATEIGV